MDHSISATSDGQEISLRGRFTFADHSSFTALVRQLSDTAGQQIVVDLSGLDFVDSAGLGMLLIARETAESKNLGFVLRGAHGQVKKTLDLGRLEALFTIQN